MSHKKYREETNCLNCGQEVAGRFCSNCGQENIEPRENFVHLIGHFVSDYLHFDSKFFRSLKPLFVKPGFLTLQYWEGKRIQFIHPLRLFFFITILFMVSTSLFYNRFGEQLKDKMVFGDKNMAKLDMAYLETLGDSAKIIWPGAKDSVTVSQVKQFQIRDARQAKKLRAGVDFVFRNLKYVTFFLLPVYALVFRLLYIRRRPFYVDHLVYTMHLQTFVYFLFSVTLLLPFMFDMSIDNIQRISILSVLIYIVFSLRFLYKQVWWKTIVKSLLSTFALVFFTAFAIVLLTFLDAMFVEK